MDKHKTWVINSEKQILSTRIFDIFSLDCYLPSKDVKNDFISIRTNDWVNTFALDEDGKVLLVKQHRLGKNLVTVEVPAGAINDNEPPEVAALRELAPGDRLDMAKALRELEEETGHVPGKLVLLRSINVNPAIQNNRCHFFLALDCKKVKEPVLDPTEELELVLFEKEEVFNAIFETDLIENSVTLMSIMLAKEYLARKIE